MLNTLTKSSPMMEVWLLFHKQRDYNDYNDNILHTKLSFSIKFLKSNKKKLAVASFYCPSKYDQVIQKMFVWTNQDSIISYTWENSKMFKTTLSYFIIFINTPLASWVAIILNNTLLFLTFGLYLQENFAARGMLSSVPTPFLNLITKSYQC